MVSGCSTTAESSSLCMGSSTTSLLGTLFFFMRESMNVAGKRREQKRRGNRGVESRERGRIFREGLRNNRLLLAIRIRNLVKFGFLVPSPVRIRKSILLN